MGQEQAPVLQCILSEIVGEGFNALPKNKLTPIGDNVEKSIQYINDNYKGITIDKYVIMPIMYI